MKASGLLGPASLSLPEIPKPDRKSHASRSWLGVPLGLLWLLSTRLCRLPDLGVILLLKKEEIGDAYSSLSDGVDTVW